ncbi:hypothetical protein ABH945_005740 [Paraburkholderia sp. GAS333]
MDARTNAEKRRRDYMIIHVAKERLIWKTALPYLSARSPESSPTTVWYSWHPYKQKWTKRQDVPPIAPY